MNVSRNLGVLVVFGVPAIIGGGIVYYLFQGYPAMIIYEILLGFFALGFIRHS